MDKGDFNIYNDDDGIQYVPIEYFAKLKEVPVKAVTNAIDLGKIKIKFFNIRAHIHLQYIEDYNFELISIYEYAERKGITPMAVYKRTENKRLPILFSVDEKSDTIKIDWELYKDEKFRSITMRFRKNKNLA